MKLKLLSRKLKTIFKNKIKMPVYF